MLEPKTTNQAPTLHRPTRHMMKMKITREHAPALFHDDGALLKLVETTVQEVLEGGMDEAAGVGKSGRTGAARRPCRSRWPRWRGQVGRRATCAR